jgi:hypothetical protein
MYAQKQGASQLIDEERQLWRVGEIECVMISCCSGAELQLRRVLSGGPAAHGLRAGEFRLKADTASTHEHEIVLRELYPTKSDLYERARDLKLEHEGTCR